MRGYSSNTPVSVKEDSSRDGQAVYPNLLTADPIYDAHESIIFPPSSGSRFRNKVIIRNDPSMFLAAAESGSEDLDVTTSKTPEEEEQEMSPMAHLPLQGELKYLHKYPLLQRRITQQTGKGKIHRMYSLMVVGNGNGLVGYGEGKDEDMTRATDKAFMEAVRNMDWVERFEDRTIWTDMDTKLGATRVILRPRPVGFGLRCNPNVHQVLKAAGIKDISAKVWGSRNPLNVIKATMRMLQAGNTPLAMGDGIGGGGRKLEKGCGVRGKEAVERERGRKMIDARTW